LCLAGPPGSGLVRPPMKTRVRPLPLVLATVVVSSIAFAAGIPAHLQQARACRAAYAQARATSHDEAARRQIAVREEDCLVAANDAVIPALAGHPAADDQDATDVPGTIQTYRDASSAFCAVLSKKSAATEPGQRALELAECVAVREGELARLVDEYASGGGGAGVIASGTATCDEVLKTARGGDAEAWSNFVGCATAQMSAKVAAFVPDKGALGDPLAAFGNTSEQVSLTLGRTMEAGKAVCDVLAATYASPARRDAARLRCRAASAASVSKAVADHAG